MIWIVVIAALAAVTALVAGAYRSGVNKASTGAAKAAAKTAGELAKEGEARAEREVARAAQTQRTIEAADRAAGAAEAKVPTHADIDAERAALEKLTEEVDK